MPMFYVGNNNNDPFNRTSVNKPYSYDPTNVPPGLESDPNNVRLQHPTQADIDKLAKQGKEVRIKRVYHLQKNDPTPTPPQQQTVNNATHYQPPDFSQPQEFYQPPVHQQHHHHPAPRDHHHLHNHSNSHHHHPHSHQQHHHHHRPHHHSSNHHHHHNPHAHQHVSARYKEYLNDPIQDPFHPVNCDCHACNPRKFCKCDACTASENANLNHGPQHVPQQLSHPPSQPAQLNLQQNQNSSQTPQRHYSPTRAYQPPQVAQQPPRGYDYNQTVAGQNDQDWSIPTDRSSKAWYHK